MVLLAFVALIGLRLLAHHHRTIELTNAELAHLPMPLAPTQSQPRPAIQSAALLCFRASPAVASVRSDGHELTVRFQGIAQQMQIEFVTDENTAIRATNANPKQLGDVYNNTIWLQTPSHLGMADIDTLGKCIPNGPHHKRPKDT